eukprot:6206252-Pleurochrysis_carterae.AAC.2
MENLGELLGVAHVVEGLGVPLAMRGFCLAARWRARPARAMLRSVFMERGRALLRDLLDRLRRAAELNRIRGGAPTHPRHWRAGEGGAGDGLGECLAHRMMARLVAEATHAGQGQRAQAGAVATQQGTQ